MWKLRCEDRRLQAQGHRVRESLRLLFRSGTLSFRWFPLREYFRFQAGSAGIICPGTKGTDDNSTPDFAAPAPDSNGSPFSRERSGLLEGDRWERRCLLTAVGRGRCRLYLLACPWIGTTPLRRWQELEPLYSYHGTISLQGWAQHDPASKRKDGNWFTAGPSQNKGRRKKFGLSTAATKSRQAPW